MISERRMKPDRRITIADDTSLTVDDIAELKKLINMSRLGKLLFVLTTGAGGIILMAIEVIEKVKGIR